eukprot:scaffold42779_cov191-Amphora_coffeaeformis.AAC.3
MPMDPFYVVQLLWCCAMAPALMQRNRCFVVAILVRRSERGEPAADSGAESSLATKINMEYGVGTQIYSEIKY